MRNYVAVSPYFRRFAISPKRDASSQKWGNDQKPKARTALAARDGAGLVLNKIRRRFSWLELIWADGG
jgi:hypothetical protein